MPRSSGQKPEEKRVHHARSRPGPAPSLFEKTWDEHVVTTPRLTEKNRPSSFSSIGQLRARRKKGFRFSHRLPDTNWPAKGAAGISGAPDPLILFPRRPRITTFRPAGAGRASRTQRCAAWWTSSPGMRGRTGIELFGLDDPRQGIGPCRRPGAGAHTAGPDAGLAATATPRPTAPSARLAFGIGASEVAHVLATPDFVAEEAPRRMRIAFEGKLAPGVGAKTWRSPGSPGSAPTEARGHAIEYAGSAGAGAVDGRVASRCATSRSRAAGGSA